MVWLSHNFDDLRHLSNLSSTISGGPATGNPSFHGLGKLQFWLGTLTNCWGWDLMFLLGFIPLKVGKTMPCLPRTGNGNHTTFRNGDDWGMVYGCLWHCFTHIIPVSSMIFPHPSYPFQDCPAMDCSGGYLIIKVWVNMPLTFWDILYILQMTPFICIHISILSSFWLILYHHWIVGSIPMNTVATNWGIPVSPIPLEQLMMLNTPLFTRTHLLYVKSHIFRHTDTQVVHIPNHIPLHILHPQLHPLIHP